MRYIITLVACLLLCCCESREQRYQNDSSEEGDVDISDPTSILPPDISQDNIMELSSDNANQNTPVPEPSSLLIIGVGLLVARYRKVIFTRETGGKR